MPIKKKTKTTKARPTKAASTNVEEAISVKNGIKATVYKDKAGEFRWRVVKKGRVIGASSEGYKRRGSAVSNFTNLCEAMRLVRPKPKKAAAKRA